jgi:hypothetical protein
MITERDLLQEIEFCQEQPITDKKFERLASCFIVYDHLFGEPMDYRGGYSGDARTPEKTIQTNGGSEFLQIVNGRNPDKVWQIVNELVEATKVLQPRMYDGFISKLMDA